MGERIQINKENNAVLLFSNTKQQWEDKTTSIPAMYSAHYYGNFTGYDIYFKGAEGKFFYKKEKVQFLNKIRNIDIEKYDVYVDGAIVNVHKLHQFEQGYYRVYVGNGTLFTKNIRLESNKHKDILKYYAKLADYAGVVDEEKGPLYLLSQNYKRITPSSNSVLFDYLKGECNPITEEQKIAVPFDFNQSQVAAIETALKHKISIIEGPPGTGKTQTILNLIASIIYQGKNCAVISNNNTAIDNIYEKLGEEKLSFVAASLGPRTKVEQFFESGQNGDLPKFLEEKQKKLKRNDSLRIIVLSNEMKKIQDTEVETSILESQLIDIQNERRHYKNVSDDALIINKKLSSTDYLAFITRLEKPKKIGFFKRWILGRKFKVRIAEQDVLVLLNNAETLYYQTKINELVRKIDSGKKFLEKQNKERVGKELKSLYRVFLENSIRSHYQKYGFKEFSKVSYKDDFENFLSRYPVVLSTSHSLLNNAPRGFTFDYLIIDEASQGDLLSNVLAMSCARNLVVVGDSRQLQQIDEERLFPESEKLSREYDVPQSHIATNPIRSLNP
ncbi:MAG: AAA domain-containing protein [bacterium]